MPHARTGFKAATSCSSQNGEMENGFALSVSQIGTLLLLALLPAHSIPENLHKSSYIIVS